MRQYKWPRTVTDTKMEENTVVRLLASGKELFHLLWNTVPIGAIHMSPGQEVVEEDKNNKGKRKKRMKD